MSKISKKINRKVFFFIFLFLVMSICTTTAYSPTHYRPIHINNTGGTEQTYYQVPLNITYDSDMNIDFSDIRVKNETSGEYVPYWIEDKVNGSWCRLWFNASYIPANSWCNDTYYLYYGDASASDASNGDSVFEFFDDFDSIDKCFKKHSTSCVVPVTESGEDDFTRDPSVLYNASSSKYQMWYWDGNIDIWYAESTDGINWTKFGEILSDVGARPSVVYKDGYYWLYLQSGSGAGNQKIKLYKSTSPDSGFIDQGVVLEPSQSWEENYIYVPSVIYDSDDDKWKMWYSAADYVSAGGAHEPEKIGYAESDDGVNWTKYSGNPIVVPSGSTWYSKALGALRVVKKDGIYYGFFHAAGEDNRFRFGYMTSTDGKTWNLDDAKLIMDLSPKGDYGSNHLYTNSPMWKDGTWKIWINGGGGSGSGHECILYLLESTNVDKLNTEKWVKNYGESITVQNSLCTINGPSENLKMQMAWSQKAVSEGVVIEGKIKNPVISSRRTGIFGSNSFLYKEYDGFHYGNNVFCIFFNENGNIRANVRSDGTWDTEATVFSDYSADTFYILHIERVSTNNTIMKVFDINRNQLGDTQSFTSPLPSSMYFGFYVQSVNAEPQGVLDWILVRKYTEPEPTAQLGAEQNVGGSGCTSPTISSLTNSTPGTTSVTITWITNQSADNRVKYSKNSDLSDALWSSWDNDTTSVSITLTGLDPNTVYYYQAWSYNSTNSSCYTTEPEGQPYNSFITQQETSEGCTSPEISSLTVSDITANSAVISWNTNQSSDNRVKYSKNSDLSNPSWSSWDNDTTSVSITLIGLDSNTTYYYQVWSYNGTNSSCYTTEPSSQPYENFTTMSMSESESSESHDIITIREWLSESQVTYELIFILIIVVVSVLVIRAFLFSGNITEEEIIIAVKFIILTIIVLTIGVAIIQNLEGL